MPASLVAVCLFEHIQDPKHDPDLNARQRFAAVRGRSYVAPDYVAGRGWMVHLDEVAYRLRVLDVLGRHAVAYRNGDYLAPIWTNARAPLGGRPCKDEREAWMYFSLVANAALARFHPGCKSRRMTGTRYCHLPRLSSRLGRCRLSMS
jgi:hypothetical protein